MSIEIVYLADQLHHVDELARRHDVEWGHLHPRIELSTRVDRLREAAGRGGVPAVLLAVDDSELVGSAALVKHDMSTRQDLSPWLAAVYVKPERRRVGIASALVESVENEAVALGVDRLYLFTEHQEQFYARRGWRLMEHTDYFDVSVAIMSKQLAVARSTSNPLAGRVALVTGVSRRQGIGAALTRRLLADGASVLASGWQAHDAEMSWGADPGGVSALLEHLGGVGARLHYMAANLEHPEAASELVDATIERFGHIDIVVANHARSSAQAFREVTAEELDRCWAINTRSCVLLAQRLAERREPGKGGRLVTFTSGQHLGPMPNEIAYAVSKGAIHQMTATLSEAVIDQGITVNCVNPGPIDTGYASGVAHQQIAKMFPAKRWGMPDDIAKLVAWLVSDEAAWITGQVLDSEGGFRR